MAKEYFDKLTMLLNELEINNNIAMKIEIKHFFSGAVLRVNETVCVSWSPVGLAFKLPETEIRKLINSGKARSLKYFPKGNIKKGYALFENPGDKNTKQWKKYFIRAFNYRLDG